MRLILPPVIVITIAIVVAGCLATTNTAPESDGPLSASEAELKDDLEALPGVCESWIGEQSFDSDYEGVVAEARVASDISPEDLATVVEVLSQAYAEITADAGFHPRVVFSHNGSGRCARGEGPERELVVDPDMNLAEQRSRSEAFLIADEVFSTGRVRVTSTAIQITYFTPAVESLEAIATSLRQTLAFDVFDEVQIAITDTIEGVPSISTKMTRSTESGLLPTADLLTQTWSRASDLLIALPEPLSPKAISISFTGDKITSLDLEVTGAEPAPDFATWQPVLAPQITPLLEFVAKHYDAATTYINLGKHPDYFLDVTINQGQAVVSGPDGDPQWSVWAAEVINTALSPVQ